MQGERERQLFLLLITGIVIVLIITVLLIISVWNKKVELDDEYNEYTLGKIYINENIDYEDYVIKYFGQIEKMLFENDVEALYNTLGQDYIKYSNTNYEKIKEYLENKKILGQALELKSYEMIQIEGYSNVYILNIKLKEGIYDINVVVRETSPNNYTIALDEYIKSETSEYNNTVNGINFVIKDITYFSNYIEYNLSIKNLHDDYITLNTNKMAENIYLKLTNSSLISPYGTVLGGREIKIEKGRTKEYKIKYNVTNENISNIESFVLKDIYYGGKNVTSDVEFVF